MTSNRNPSGSSGFRAGRPTAGKDAPPPELPSEAFPPKGRFFDSWARFWFTAANPVGLHWMRIFSGLLFISWLLPFAGQVDAFFGQQGWFDQKAYEETSKLEKKMREFQEKVQRGENPATDPDDAQQSLPNQEWSLLFLVWSDSTLLHLFYWASLGVFLLFTLGVATRLTSILTWFLVVSYLANPVWRHDADFLLAILAFYLMIGYGLQGLWSRELASADLILGPRDNFVFATLLGNKPASSTDSAAANLALRLFQVHFAMIVVVSGLHKLQFGPWWGGVAFLYPLHDPFNYDSYEVMRSQVGTLSTNLWWLSLAQYLVLIWQILFPGFAWRNGMWRVLSVGGAAVGWVGSFYLYGQPLFGPFFLIGCLAYLTPAEWHWLSSLVRGDDAGKAKAAVNTGVRVPVTAGS